ncbi:sugar phosphate isomerase/epimerase family protein [Candidatus Xianfuyuplasma coldseepsis]|uniref:Sugar phosphate isomerase/epimerase n=1 Tax=Candidatus Xianfuyuplasma coldseepsis TaxID=2782163 RepID=A0A7L7KTI0_9MOLU|nr:sugar phosphate isomerase/epimerase [Xianfuyuplasma coldseepsis]QMS85068.1 sugar phosphate isomerase/epimerase [Xianfuyuplasma coldseepsis]
MNVAVQLYSLRDYIQTKETLEDTLQKLKSMGCEYVQLSGFGRLTDEKITWYKELFPKYSIQIIATHIDYNQLQEEFDYIVQFHHDMNIPYVGVGALPSKFARDKVKDYQHFIFEMNILGTKLQKQGLQLTYHNHSFEFVQLGPFIPFDILYQNMDQRVVQFLPDFYWLQAAGVNPLQFIQKYHANFDIVHLKDMRVQLVNDWITKPVYCSIGDGNMDYKSIIETLYSKNTKYYIIEQDQFLTNNPFNEIKRSIDFTINTLQTCSD